MTRPSRRRSPLREWSRPMVTALILARRRLVPSWSQSFATIAHWPPLGARSSARSTVDKPSSGFREAHRSKYFSAPSTRYLLADDRDLEPLRSRDDFQALIARSARVAKDSEVKMNRLLAASLDSRITKVHSVLHTGVDRKSGIGSNLDPSAAWLGKPSQFPAGRVDPAKVGRDSWGRRRPGP